MFEHLPLTYSELARVLKSKGYRIRGTNILQTHCETIICNQVKQQTISVRHDTDSQFIKDVVERLGI